ncbi:MAG: AAA family ATPase, partial [Corynebacterium sphenisci]|nr:AAA family ATPase [Corynebacterium sphenisci]
FDRMWVAMIRSGRPVPQVGAGDPRVEVTLSAGPPDIPFIEGLARVGAEFGEQYLESVDLLIVLRWVAVD